MLHFTAIRFKTISERTLCSKYMFDKGIPHLSPATDDANMMDASFLIICLTSDFKELVGNSIFEQFDYMVCSYSIPFSSK